LTGVEPCRLQRADQFVSEGHIPSADIDDRLCIAAAVHRQDRVRLPRQLQGPWFVEAGAGYVQLSVIVN
jgi:hypothetical protein